jgi:hypothetical protein
LLAETVIIVEGEKDVETLRRRGFTATTNAGGACKWTADLNDWFAGKIVYILPDRDLPGAKHAYLVAENLTGIAAEVRIVELPPLPSGENFKDITEWLEKGGDAAKPIKICEAAPIYEPRPEEKQPTAELALITVAEVQPKPIDWIWPGRLALGKLTLIAGDPGLGKSHIGLDVVARITSGKPWPEQDSASAPLGSCIILSAEDSIDDVLRPRLEAAGADLTRVHALQGVRARDREGHSRSTLFSLQYDLELLGEKIVALADASSVMIDPITALSRRSSEHARDRGRAQRAGTARRLRQPLWCRCPRHHSSAQNGSWFKGDQRCHWQPRLCRGGTDGFPCHSRPG